MHPKLIPHYRTAFAPITRFHGVYGLQNAGVQKPRQKSRFHTECKLVCAHCHTSSTPLWRKVNQDTVCNACGIYWRTHSRLRPVQNTDTRPNDKVYYHKVVKVREVYSDEELIDFSRKCVIHGFIIENLSPDV